MNRIAKNTARVLTVLLTITLLAGLAAAQDNGRYGETRFNELPATGVAEHELWVGSWWAYTGDGIALRHKRTDAQFREQCQAVTAEMSPQEVIDANATFCLSTAEKIDYLMGRIGDIEWDAINDYQDVAQGDLGDLQEERRDLVTRLNRWIGENEGEDWRETEDGERYLAIEDEIQAAEDSLPEIDVDTATEFERIEHGRGVPGVGGWWGHCNAWAAASTHADEPRYETEVTVDGRTVTFTPGEVKALLTEAYMEIRSSFQGSRHNGSENEGLTYDDVTPAGFHVFFGTQLGQRQRGFVIDRYTGDQVWNQSTLAYRWNAEAAYTTDENGAPVAETVELTHTDYNRFNGNAELRELGETEVYPVSVTATIYWMTDGLPHEADTLEGVWSLSDLDVGQWPVSDFAGRDLWENQVHSRNLTYTLWLDKPMDDDSARIIGDGQWNHASEGSNQAHPDFLWQFQAQTPSSRNYENPFIEFETLVTTQILPGSLVEPADPDAPVEEPTDPTTVTAAADDTPIEIPDNDATGVSSTITVAEQGTLAGGSLTLDITHTWRGDLSVQVNHGDASVELHSRGGGSADNLQQTFDLAELAGAPVGGDYVLVVSDNAGQDLGTLNSWSVELQYQ